MARARNIKPGFFRNADLVDLPFEARLLFIGLWTIADRAGRIEDRPKQIKMELFPADNVDCDALIGQLASMGMVQRYEHAGKRYLQVVNFTKHQNPHRDEKASTLPGPCGFDVPNEPHSAEYGAGTVQAQCDSSGSTVAIGLIPDPLIPDPLKEPNGSVGSADRLPRCDVQSVVDLYHGTLPELPRVRLMTDGRRKAVSAFWRFVLTSKKSDGSPRATNADEAMGWISGYFGRARDNDFLMGRGHKAPGHEGWQCDFDFLLTEKGKKHVIEKTKEAA